MKHRTNWWLITQAGSAIPDSLGDGSATDLSGEPSTAGTPKSRRLCFVPFHQWMGFNQKLRAILKENWNKEPGPTLTIVLPLFVSAINTRRANLDFGST